MSLCYDKPMNYAQKYTLVAFVRPVGSGTEFNMADWPLHITLADVFAVDRNGVDLNAKLRNALKHIPTFTVTAGEESRLGTARVVLIEKNTEISMLHAILIDLLASSGAVFNTPRFTREGFLPHCTVQKSGRLPTGDIVRIDTLYLVDMFPDGDWEQRKVLSVFKLRGSKP